MSSGRKATSSKLGQLQGASDACTKKEEGYTHVCILKLVVLHESGSSSRSRPVRRRAATPPRSPSPARQPPTTEASKLTVWFLVPTSSAHGEVARLLVAMAAMAAGAAAGSGSARSSSIVRLRAEDIPSEEVQGPQVRWTPPTIEERAEAGWRIHDHSRTL